MSKINKSRAAWCDRALLQASYIGLCVTEGQFYRELKKLKIPSDECVGWVRPGCGACTWFFQHRKLGRMAIVCIKVRKKSTIEQQHALLVHEAMHIWQHELRHMDEDRPGSEVEAYSVQAISQNLMVAFGQLTGKKRRPAAFTG